MAWTINFSETAAKQLKKMDKGISKKIITYLKERVAKSKDATTLGKALMHDKSGIWRYRVGDYRIMCEIKNKELIVLVLRIGHRKDVYED